MAPLAGGRTSSVRPPNERYNRPSQQRVAVTEGEKRLSSTSPARQPTGPREYRHLSLELRALSPDPGAHDEPVAVLDRSSSLAGAAQRDHPGLLKLPEGKGHQRQVLAQLLGDLHRAALAAFERGEDAGAHRVAERLADDVIRRQTVRHG
jgi:hypothetical protein